MAGKALLPEFGGTAAVWTHCLLFFQSALLVGYLYAHGLGALPDLRKQVWIHLLLCTLGALWTGLSLMESSSVMEHGGSESRSLLFWLARSLGLPYVLLAATSPLAQRWLSARFPGTDPYPLFAWRNAGSLLALLAYPFVLEPLAGLKLQRILWSFGLLACLFILAQLGRTFFSRGAPEPVGPELAREELDGVALGLWVLLPAAGTLALVAFTQSLTQEVAPMPFLWVLPLALYLLSFVLPFDKRHLYARSVCGPLLLAAAALLIWGLFNRGSFGLVGLTCIFGGALFFLCLSLHGELHRLRPGPTRLTLYYLAIAFGGALGGIASGLVAPRLFSGFWEFHLSIFGGCLLVLLCWYLDSSFAGGLGWRRVLWALLLAAQVALGLSLASHVSGEQATVLESHRSFYGVLRVLERRDAMGVVRFLQNGNIMHGWQYRIPGEELKPGGYYWPLSGIGLAFTRHPKRSLEGGRLNIGVIGLGVGTLAAYAREGDQFRFYEINPEVARMAGEYFTYLKESIAPYEIVLGDARLELEKELEAGRPQRFDLLVVDAFNGDSIPVHLMTAEAVSTYLQHLEPDGLLIFHITNQYLDFSPVIRGLGTHFGLRRLVVETAPLLEEGHSASVWGILTRNPDFLDASGDERTPPIHEGKPERSILWTDDNASLLPLLGRPGIRRQSVLPPALKPGRNLEDSKAEDDRPSPRGMQ